MADPPDFNDSDYDAHYRERYAVSGHDYAHVQYGYRFGYEMANDQRFMGRSWADVEQELKGAWHRRYTDRNWDDIRDAVREGYGRGLAHHDEQ